MHLVIPTKVINNDDVKIHQFVIYCRSYLEKNVRLLMEGVDELCQDANKFNNHLRNVARQQQQKEAYTQRRVKSISVENRPFSS